MKECPICHELNDDNRDSCKKCHASLDFKIYNAYQNDREKQKDYAVDKNTVIKYFDLICTNECQDNLELLNSKGFSNDNLSLQIKIIDNSNDTEITVFADKLKIGYIPKDKIHFFKICDAMFDAAELFIYSKDSILFARISVVFQRISDSIADEYINKEVKKEVKICNHCGRSSDKISNGLCSNCNRSKIILKIILYFFVSFIYGFGNTLLRSNGILLGAIPTMLLVAVLLFLANYIPNRIYNK